MNIVRDKVRTTTVDGKSLSRDCLVTWTDWANGEGGILSVSVADGEERLLSLTEDEINLIQACWAAHRSFDVEGEK